MTIGTVFGGFLTAQPISVGVLAPPFSPISTSPFATVIELGAPASTDGQVTSATFLWSASPCPNAVKLKFFRPNGVILQYLGERGPFDVSQPTQVVTLAPAVVLRSGDLIGITRLTTCGGPVSSGPVPPPLPPPHGSLVVEGDVRSDVPNASASAFDVIVQATEVSSLSLLRGRFRVTLVAVDGRSGMTANGVAMFGNDRFGYFSLPALTGDPAFPEVVVKMADASGAPPPFGGSFWVFHASLTDVRYTLTIVDQSTGKTRQYSNPVGLPGQLCGGADTNAFTP